MIDSNEDKQPLSNNSELNPKINSWAEVANEDSIVFSIFLSVKDKSKFSRLSAMIAYAQYSLHKHQFIDKYTQEKGIAPTDDQIKTIIRSFQDKDSYILENFSKQSDKLLTDIIEEYESKTYQEKFVKPVEKIIKDNTKFWISVKAGIVATFIYSLLIAIVIFMATVALPDTKLSRIIQILFE